VIIGAPAITAALVGFNLGRIRQRIPIRIALSVSAATWVIGMALIGSAGALALVIIGSLSYGIGEGALIPNLQEVAVSAAPPEHRGAVVATWVGFARLGQTSGPLLAGVLLSAQGAPAVFWAGAIASAAAMVAFVLGPIGRTDRPPAAPGP
jgi:MFS family permease